MQGETDAENLNLLRTKTMPPQSSNRPQISRKLTMVPAKIDPGLERIKHAKTTAEKAMKVSSNRNLDPYENLMFE